MQQTIQDMERSCDPLYAPYEPDQNLSPVCRNLTQKQGYLHIRNKTGLVSSSWERQYFFTQGGNLMRQGRGEVAGSLLTDLDNSSVMAVDCDDRRFCFQVTSFDGKKTVTLQSESRKDCEEWIATINNISKRIYLSENAEELAARVNQSALEAVTPSPSFQQRHESLRPGRWVSRGSGLRGQGERHQQRSSRSLLFLPAEAWPALAALARRARSRRRPCPCSRWTRWWPPTRPSSSTSSHPSARNTQGRTRRRHRLEDGAIPSERPETRQKTTKVPTSFIHRWSTHTHTHTHTRITVVRSRLDPPPALHRSLPGLYGGEDGRVGGRHLGDHEADPGGQGHPQHLQDDRVTPAGHMRLPQFPLASVLQCSSHQDNKRLFGFVLQAAAAQGDTRAVCYIFESNNEGEKICDSVGLAKQIAFHSEMDWKAVEKKKEQEKAKEKHQEELSKQRQIEKV
ncbi:unnamed protein product, partial [Tetraodon nigroviridis]